MPATEFIFIAALMVIAALALIVLPLTAKGDQAPIAAGVVVALLPLSVALLYFSYSNWQWSLPANHTPTASDGQVPSGDEQVPSIDEMVVRLEQRLQSNPDDAEGWQMLGRTFMVMSRYPEAVEAYEKARQLSGDADVNAITGYAEALAMMRGGVVDDQAAALFEKALQISPNDTRALWYGGIAAFERGEAAVARGRWQKLLSLNPPEEVTRVLREQIAAADAVLGTPGEDAIVVTPAPVPAGSQTAGLTLTVSLATELAGRVSSDAALFILARQIGAPGPPLAVIRKRAGELPLQLVLSDADAMVAGRVISAYESVEVVARIALGGTPTAQPGDLFGSKIVANNETAAILIDAVVGN